MYTAKNIETGEIVPMTEEQVQAEIIRFFQNDMGTVFGEGKTAEEIAVDVAESMYAYFEDGPFETDTYEITRH